MSLHRTRRRRRLPTIEVLKPAVDSEANGTPMGVSQC